jgi:outer membrane protein assembly factor BamB
MDEALSHSLKETIYISSVPSDQDFVRKLRQDLQAQGFDIASEDTNLTDGKNVRRQAIAESHVVLIVVSPESLASPQVKADYVMAGHLGKELISLLYRPIHSTTMPRALARLPQISFQAGEGLEQRYPQGLQALSKLLESRTSLQLAEHDIPARLGIRLSSRNVLVIASILLIFSLVVGIVGYRLHQISLSHSTPAKLNINKWTFHAADTITTAPVVANGIVYFETADNEPSGNPHAKVYALNASSGKVKWAYSISTGSFINSSLVITNGLLYVGTSGGDVYALDALSGKEKWFNTTNGIGLFSLIVANGIVYVVSVGDASHVKVNALDASSGQVKWSYNTAISIDLGTFPFIMNGMIYISSSDHNIYALDAQSGNVKWTYNVSGNLNFSLMVANGMVIAEADSDGIYALDAISGKVKWSYNTGGHGSISPTVANGMVIVEAGNGEIYAFDSVSGRVKWTSFYKYDAAFSPIITSERVYMASKDGRVYSLDAISGDMKWSYYLEGAIVYYPATSSDVKWSYYLGGSIAYSPIMANGMLFVVSGDSSGNRKIYALDITSAH